MKAHRICLMVLALATLLVTCEKKEDQIHITSFEDQLAKAVNVYRDSVGLNQLAHNFDVLSREAKAHAQGRANGTITEDQVFQDMEQRWIRVYEKWGIDNVSNHDQLSVAITGEINATNVKQVAQWLIWEWAADSIGKIKLEGDYTVQGPGEARASDGTTYVMHMFCKFQ